MRHAFSRPSLAPALLLLWALGVPCLATARTQDTFDSDVSTRAVATECRGNLVLATVDSVIEDYQFFLGNTSGVSLDWYVFEGTSPSGAMNQIGHGQGTGSSGSTATWQSSGVMMTPVEAGKYYGMLVCWQSTSPAVTYRYNNASNPASPSWGSYTYGIYTSTGTATTGQVFGYNSHRVRMRTFTAPGDALAPADPYVLGASSSNFVRGNAFDVTEDTLLRSVRQYAQVTASTGAPPLNLGTYSVPWYLYRCPGACGTGQTYTQVASYSGFGLAGSGAVFDTWLAWSPNIVLEAGYRYFVGIDLTASGVGVNNFRALSGSPQVTAEFGQIVAHGSISLLTGSTPTSAEPVNLTNSQVISQRIEAVRVDSDGQTGATTYALNNTSTFGNIYYVTDPTHISELQFRLGTGVEGSFPVGVYRGASQNGSYTRIWSGQIEHTTSTTWWASQELGLDLDPDAAGGAAYYAFVVQSDGSGTAYGQSNGDTVHPVGTRVGSFFQSSASSGMPATATLSGTANVYFDWNLVTCDQCVDLDGDGVEVGDGLANTDDDCDDGDATVYPGAPELCDGKDNDCNGSSAGESDSDGDGVRVCAGDCDDSVATTYPGAPEICDGADSDCNSSIPASEQDNDGDGFVTCAYVGTIFGSLLGGSDCDDGDPTVSPGETSDVCDGLDTNCDGRNLVASAGGPGSSASSSAPVFFGNGYQADNGVVVEGMSVELTPSPSASATVSFLIYQDIGGGTYQLAWQDNTTIGPGGPKAWFATTPGAISFPLDAGSTYLFAVHLDGPATYEWDNSALVPVAQPLGELLGGYGTYGVGATPPSTEGLSLGAYTFDLRVFSGSETDGDGDAYLSCEECDDTESAVFPGAPELCDGIDNNCDGSVPASEVDGDNDGALACADCDDNQPLSFPGNPEVCDGVDNDCNGTVPASEANDDGDGYRICSGDCDDTRSQVYPGAPELCDDLDNDCDGQLLSTEIDNDGDGFDECAGFDCDDADSSSFPGAPELCDGLDNDCDASVPAAEADDDGDGARVCDGDCADGDPSTYPGATELCDGIDNDCNGTVPSSGGGNENDNDNDGARVCAGDCGDSDPNVGPGFSEICDGKDSDCDSSVPAIEVDNDGDAYIDCVLTPGGLLPPGIVGGSDCDDGAAAVYPGAPELCDGATVDNNCSGSAADEGADVDGDGANTCTDCDDTDPNVFPGAAEICDGKNSDCAFGTPASEQDPDGDGYIQCTLAGGATPPTFVLGGGDCLIADASSYPGAPELCDAIDNDCDLVLPTNEQDPDGDGSLECGGDCAPNDGLTYPGASESCDGIDNDCNGTVPGNENDNDSDGQRVCGGDCNDGNATIYVGAPALCDGRDNDCVGGLEPLEVDADGDTFFTCTYVATGGNASFGGGDCDDSLATFYPGATELCDGLDGNCDGLIPVGEQDVDGDGVSTCEGDCADNNPLRTPGAPELCDGIDNDCDGAVEAGGVDADGDGVLVCAGDCNDGNANVYPGNTEVCDGLNNDCAGGIDDPFNVDGDGFFAGPGCSSAYAQVDCDDSVASIYPGATEVCDNVDQDCDGSVDEDFDGDGDGYVDGSVGSCVSSWPAAQLDCDDGSSLINPAATEVCDAVDNDCDSSLDEGFDVDGDGVTVCGPNGVAGNADDDCNDNNAANFPGNTELCDGGDNDCDSAVDETFDLDGDGYFDTNGPGCGAVYGALVDCDDGQALSYPGAIEICDGEDNDCDTAIDEDFDQDGDSFLDSSCLNGPDCDDGDPAINPLATEVCDSADNDCNGAIDDGFDGDGDGAFDGAIPACASTYGALADCDDSDSAIFPGQTEVCDAVDQDCDGPVDEDFDVDGDGALDGSDPGCAAAYAAAVLDCDDGVSTTYPGATEVCNDVDDDCDGVSDLLEGFDVDGDGFATGANPDCVAAYPYVDCDDAVATRYPGATELCNDVDDDCDGVVPAIEIDNDGDGFDECGDGDCDDTLSSVFAGAFELCNNIDDNCSGTVDENYDADGDGYTDGANAGCVQAYGAANVDCNDAVAAINPGETETCNGVDDDCAGGVDDTFDLDDDGYFAGTGCGAVYTELDCDDGLFAVNPGQSEDCSNGIDDDCDGSADIGFDVDGDGVDTCNGDCNDNNASVNPTITEICDLVDNNCNQQIDEGFDGDGDGQTSCGGDCDDSNPTVSGSAPELCDALDNDCDLQVDENFDLDLDLAYAGTNCASVWPASALDCNDGNVNINPSASEICDAVDNNCNGVTDEGFDADGDLAFDAAVPGCAAAYGSGADCNDADPVTYPGATELCDGLDNDCNSSVPLVEVDNDGDGYVECAPVPGHVGNPTGGGDCADGAAAVFPGATELCNVIDDNCDGVIDEIFDADGDGAVDGDIAACEANYPIDELDCDDADPNAAPSLSEVCDAVDNDCNGSVDDGFDLDGDGYFDGADPDCVLAWTQTDCDDANAFAFPGNIEDCGNGIDDNCNGAVDEDVDVDGDGYSTCNGDCDDDNAAVNPGVVEICDGLDQDCNFVADDLFDGDGDGYVEAVACAGVYPADELDCDDGDAAINPDATELCDAADNDCDTEVDENYDLDSDLAFDRFDGGCVATYGVAATDCDDGDPTVNPSATEICDGADNNCNVVVDEGFDVDGDGVWADEPGCVATYGGPLDCDDGDASVYPPYDDGSVSNPGADELCDGLDNDCDGVIPEDVDGDGFLADDGAGCTGDDLDCDDGDASINVDADEICDDAVDNDCDSLADGDDPDCIVGDDDDSGDDDDDDDDDDVVSEVPPELDPDYDGEGPSLAGGCFSCLGDVSGGGGSGGALALLVMAGIALRRRRRGAPLGTGPVLVLMLALGGAMASPAVASAQALDQEAERQLDFAWKELEAQRWEKAIASAESALRLNPALYTAMVVKALAYEGMGELRKSESWLQTYLELTKSLSQAPEAKDLAERLRSKGAVSNQVKASATVKVGKKRTAFGDGGVLIGGVFGGRDYSQTPCAPGEGCAEGAETRPGFWATDGSGFGGGLSVRAEYFFGGSFVGARVRYDLGAGEPVGVYDVGASPRPGHRLDAGVVFRPQLVGGLVSVRLMLDVAYGMRTWGVYETVASGTPDTAASFAVVAHQVGGGIGVRVEPWQVIGFDVRYGVAGLLGGAGGINDHSVELGLGIRPAKPLLVRAGLDMHIGSLALESTREGATYRAGLNSMRAGLFLGAGVVF